MGEVERLRKLAIELQAHLDTEKKAAIESRLAADRSRRDIDELHAAIFAAQRWHRAQIAGVTSVPFPIASAVHVRQAIVVAAQAPVTESRFPPEDRQAELAAAERAISERLPEDDGYVSPWEVNRLPVPMKWHHEWRSARAQYAATGSPDALDSMLAYVTADNPPMRSQGRSQRGQGIAPRTVARSAVRLVVLTVCVTAMALIVLATAGFFLRLILIP